MLHVFVFVTNCSRLLYEKRRVLSSRTSPGLLRRFSLRDAAGQLVQRERDQILDGDWG